MITLDTDSRGPLPAHDSFQREVTEPRGCLRKPMLAGLKGCTMAQQMDFLSPIFFIDTYHSIF